MMVVWLLGMTAGVLTTLAGLGGGLLLVVTLSLYWDPRTALAVTALALFVANGHRLLLFRRHVDGRVARLLFVGAFPGCLAGALLAVRVPERVLHLIILAVVALALSRAVFAWTWRFPRRALVPAAAVVGGLTATAGGAGVLVGPLLLSSGVEGESYIATAAFTGVTMHVARVVGYSAGGMVDRHTLSWAALLAAALMVGNLCGRALRGRMNLSLKRRIEYGSLVVCALLSLIGVG
jgi:uncharacterized membrane protein YfcA